MVTRSLTTESEGLTKLVEHIERLVPQCPPGFRSNENKIRFLRKAVLGFDWALVPIRNIVSHRYKFNAFVTALHESLQLATELKGANATAFQTRVAEPDAEKLLIPSSSDTVATLAMFASIRRATTPAMVIQSPPRSARSDPNAR